MSGDHCLKHGERSRYCWDGSGILDAYQFSMLGWQVFIRRPTPGVLIEKLSKDTILADWETGLYGINWADELVKEGKAVQLSFNGYPCTYIAAARDILPRIKNGPPPNDSPSVV